MIEARVGAIAAAAFTGLGIGESNVTRQPGGYSAPARFDQAIGRVAGR
jgi:hypothetical protein